MAGGPRVQSTEERNGLDNRAEAILKYARGASPAQRVPANIECGINRRLDRIEPDKHVIVICACDSRGHAWGRSPDRQ